MSEGRDGGLVVRRYGLAEPEQQFETTGHVERCLSVDADDRGISLWTLESTSDPRTSTLTATFVGTGIPMALPRGEFVGSVQAGALPFYFHVWVEVS